jgi:hypothetical protein
VSGVDAIAYALVIIKIMGTARLNEIFMSLPPAFGMALSGAPQLSLRPFVARIASYSESIRGRVIVSASRV